MKTKTRTRSPEMKTFLNRVAILMSLIVITAAGGGLSLLWMRSAISGTAARVRNDETQIAEVKRRLQFVNVKIAQATTPDMLRRQAARFGLVPPSETQVVRLAPPAHPTRTLPTSAVASDLRKEPLYASYELALIKSAN